MRIAVDKDKCSGCHICEQTCSAYHNKSINIYRSRIRLQLDELLPKAPQVCMQCKNPMCLKACAYEALFLDDDGIVQFNEEKCVRCNLCMEKCPFGTMFIDSVTQYPLKCDLCQGRPRCIEQCPEKALSLK